MNKYDINHVNKPNLFKRFLYTDTFTKKYDIWTILYLDELLSEFMDKKYSWLIKEDLENVTINNKLFTPALVSSLKMFDNDEYLNKFFLRDHL